MFKSIKARIFLWLITSFAIIITALGFFLFSRLNTYAIDMVDHLLSHKSDLLKGLIHVDKKGELEFELSEITSGDYSIIKSGHYFELTDGRGVSIVKSKSLNDSTIVVTNKEAGYHTVAGPSGEPMRLFIEEFSVNGERFFIYVAEGISKELSLLKSFKVILIFFFPLTVIVSGLGSILIVLISFMPVASFSRQIGLITEKRLYERIDSQGVDTELKGLASSFNETMDRLEKAFQAQRDFLSDASHELRTPAAVIKSTVDVALRRERSAVEYRVALQTVKAASERMGGLIDRLLKLSRQDAEQIIIKERVNLKEVMGTALKTITPLAEERKINVSIEKMEDVTIVGDGDQLVELFLSVLDNAIKYNRHMGSVIISLARSANWGVVRVSDTGIGIAPEALGKVFDRFYRADFSRGEIPGTGLGLPIAKGIAEAHGGRIEVESEAGWGTTFIVYLPVSQ